MKELELRTCQIEALQKLKFHRENGANKALVVMASSLGKTITAIYDIEVFMKNRLDRGRALILCHSNSILNDLRAAFEDVLGADYTYGSFSGVDRCLEKTDFLFATFQSVRLYMNEFEPNEFAYIVVDECHHAKADTFEEVIQHFEPEFLLGLTATPVRTDGKQITDIFGDAIHEVDLVEAISNGLVAAIDYRLMLDDILAIKNFISEDNQKITLAELNKRIFVPKRDEEIVNLINEKTAERKNPKTIIFCSTIEHAERMANLIPKSTIVHSKIKAQENLDRIEGFKDGRYSTIVSVDMLNEGVDIPKADVIVFLRSTVSPIVYYQQMGRGLRLHASKDNVLILDFIANCERIEMIESFKDKVIDSMKKSSTYKPHKRLKRFNVNIDKPEFAEMEVDILAKIKQARTNQNKKWTGLLNKEYLTGGMQRFAKELGKTTLYLSDLENCDYLPHDGHVYTKVFGSWNNALKAAGLKSNERSMIRWNKIKWSEDLIIQNVIKLSKELGRVPDAEDVNQCSYLPSRVTIFKYCGNYNQVLIKAGLKEKKATTKEELIESVKTIAQILGHTPSAAEAEAFSFMPDHHYAAKIFGSWNNLLKEAGLKCRCEINVWNKERIIECILIKAEELKRKPTCEEMKLDKRMPGVRTINRYFGTWNKALEAAGLEPNKNTYRK